MQVFLVLALIFSIAQCAPCDIYAKGGTPCVAAHSTVRALYDSYTGPLYQVARSSDNTTQDIGLLSIGGIANSTEQDVFCSGTGCNITIIYDQSGMSNHLTVGPPGGANANGNTPANANAESVTVQGQKVYSVYINPGQGYFHDGANQGIPTGTEPGGIYMVTAGTHVNSGCCFDYGNGEANHHDNGAGHMNAINFGTNCWAQSCEGNGPWLQADLENGLWGSGNNSRNPVSFPERFVTAMEKSDGTATFALRGGDAQSGNLTTVYDGPLPNGYAPMSVEGGIILGTGGDDSSWSAGTFYEGAMTKGWPADAIEDAVQLDILGAQYAV